MVPDRSEGFGVRGRGSLCALACAAVVLLALAVPGTGRAEAKKHRASAAQLVACIELTGEHQTP
jgi:hypothetical protein